MNSKDAQIDKTPLLAIYTAWVLILLLIIQGVLTISFLFPLASSESKKAYIQRWSKKLLKILRIQLVVVGEALLPNGPNLLVSNHISWVDIHAINAFKPIRFVAKSEVASWPVFGWMAKNLNTVFIRRDSSRHARKVVSQLGSELKYDSVCIFPEGTSTVGDDVLPFKPNLFESALMAKAPVCPMAIQYFSAATGVYTAIPAFIGDMTLLESMSSIIHSQNLIVQLTFLPSINTNHALLDRKTLAFNTHNAIASVIYTSSRESMSMATAKGSA